MCLSYNALQRFGGIWCPGLQSHINPFTEINVDKKSIHPTIRSARITYTACVCQA